MFRQRFDLLRENAIDLSKRYTTRDIKDKFLEFIEPYSTTAHTYCKGLFKHQEAQQVYQRLRDKQDREELVRKGLEASLNEYERAQKNYQHFLQHAAPMDFVSDDHKLYLNRRTALEAEVDNAKKQYHLKQNSMMETINSLKDLDDHTDTYRLFATSVHYGYFVLIVLGWLLYSMYYMVMWARDRVPAQRKDLNVSQRKTVNEIKTISEKMEKLAVAVATVGSEKINQNANEEKMADLKNDQIEKKQIDENEHFIAVVETFNKILKNVDEKLDKTILMIEQQQQQQERAKTAASSSLVQWKDFGLMWKDFLERNNPINILIQMFVLIMLGVLQFK